MEFYFWLGLCSCLFALFAGSLWLAANMTIY
jgi:hypothetical protein